MALLPLLALAAAQPCDTPLETVTDVAMSTRIAVTLPASQMVQADVAFAAFHDVEAEANEWRPASALSVVNSAAGRHPVVLSSDLFGLLVRGVEISAATGGAYDITWGALWDLWDFGSGHPTIPSMEAIDARLGSIDYRRVQLDPAAQSVYISEPGVVIGLGGLAKGHALDRAVSALRGRGVGCYSISAGGQVAVGGLREGRPWRVGIRDPRGEPLDSFAILELTDTSVSTSGDYERFFLEGGVRYHHILDPKTGLPSRGVRSATVISDDATLADGLSTAFMVMPRAESMELAEAMPQVEVVLVDDRGRVWQSSGVALLQRHPPLP